MSTPVLEEATTAEEQGADRYRALHVEAGWSFPAPDGEEQTHTFID